MRVVKSGRLKYLTTRAQEIAATKTTSSGDRIISLRNVSPEFTVQKLNYTHNNPVEAGIVDKVKNIYIVVPGTIITEETVAC